MEIILGIVIACLLASIYGIYNLLQKLERYEDFIEEETTKNQALLEALREID
jgi:hypothetical protein